jgi:glyoxylate carboligase
MDYTDHTLHSASEDVIPVVSLNGQAEKAARKKRDRSSNHGGH